MPNIRSYQGKFPIIAKNSYIDESSIIIGDVIIDENVSIWCNTVIRADVGSIHIGKNSNVQDLSLLHLTRDDPGHSKGSSIIIGENVTIGHKCCLHGCKIANNVLVGMGTIILDDAMIEEDVLIGSGSLVPKNKVLKSGYLYLGSPVKAIRLLNEEELSHIKYSANSYVLHKDTMVVNER